MRAARGMCAVDIPQNEPRRKKKLELLVARLA
jgi:hypothetical protein